MPLATELAAIKSASTAIHRDREWWRKILIGGALWLTIIGYSLVEGYQIESIENTQNGFPTPLPRWNAFANKAITGLLAVVIDFFYFVFPLLLAGMLLLCATFAAVLAGTGGDQIKGVGVVAGSIAVGWFVLAWLSSVSPVGKRRLVADGQPGEALSSRVVWEAWRRSARGPYLRARLRSLPLYVLPLALLSAAWYGANWSGWLALPLAWLGCAALLYVRLVVIQPYAMGAREIQQREFEAFQARTGS